MEVAKNKEINIGGSIFWISFSLLSLMWLSYLAIWSYQNNSIKGVVISMIFFAMIVSGIVLSRFEIFDIGTWKENSISFTIGFGLWAFINGFFGTQSILSVSQNHLFASISGELPQFIDVLMTAFIVPVAEEIFWMFAIPYAVLSILNVLGKKYDFFKNLVTKIIIVAIISSLSFAFFHVGKTAFTFFVISAIIFRVAMIVAVFGEKKFNYLKKFNLVASFSVGAHIANNLIIGGFSTAWQVLQSNYWIFSILLVLFGAIFLTTLNALLRVIIGKKDKGVEI